MFCLTCLVVVVVGVECGLVRVVDVDVVGWVFVDVDVVVGSLL